MNDTPDDEVLMVAGNNGNGLAPIEPTEPIKIEMMLHDWQSEDGSEPSAPIATNVSLSAHRIDLIFADGRSIWIEKQDEKIRIHGYLSEGKGHHEPLNMDIHQDKFFLETETPGAAFEKTVTPEVLTDA